MRGAANIKVNRPLEEVWHFISDLENSSQWLDGVSSVETTSEGEIGPGATFTSKYRFDSKSHQVSYVLTTLEPPNRICFRVSGGPHPAFNDLELKPDGDSTKVVYVMEMDVTQRSIGAVFLGLGPIVRLSIMMKLRKDLKKLKKQLESG